MQAHILQIQRFCIHDGPGVRTTVFLKGCPLRCAWCHNPESQHFGTELSYFADQCLHCMACATVCPQQCHSLREGAHVLDRSRCIGCGQCAAACPGALEMIGLPQKVEDVMAVVRQDKPFYSTEGGLTLSGGEPLSQAAFSAALLETAKAEGIHTCVETSGYAAEEALKSVSQFCDLFLYDLKLANDALHQQWTGVSNQQILHNLHLLNEWGKPVILRCIFLPDGQDDAHWQGIANLAHQLSNIQAIHILPYHVFGTEKARRTGGEPIVPFPKPPEPEAVRKRTEWLSSLVDIPVQTL